MLRLAAIVTAYFFLDQWLQSRWMRYFTERKGGLQEVYLQTPLLNLLAANNVLTRGLPVDQIYKRLSL